MGPTILMLIADTILGILSVLLLLLIINLFTFYRLRTTTNTASEATPSVSILVPARNEEHCIATCLHSLISQQHEHLEVLVLDDQSSDATATIVQRVIDSLSQPSKIACTSCMEPHCRTTGLGKISPAINWHNTHRVSICSSQTQTPFTHPRRSRQ